MPIEKGIASILLCGILADTLSLQSATVTDTDVETADYLSSITGLEIKDLSRDLLTAANQIDSMTAQDIVTLDMKEYTEQGSSFTVSQVEIDNAGVMAGSREEISAALEKERTAKGYLFAALLVTDVTVLDSLLFVAGNKSFTELINYPAAAPDVFELKGVVSRKKQLIPILSELVEKWAAENSH